MWLVCVVLITQESVVEQVASCTNNNNDPQCNAGKEGGKVEVKSFPGGLLSLFIIAYLILVCNLQEAR